MHGRAESLGYRGASWNARAVEVIGPKLRQDTARRRGNLLSFEQLAVFQYDGTRGEDLY